MNSSCRWARQPFAAAAEHHCGGDAESQRAAAGGGKPADLADEPQAARQLIDRDLVLDPVRDTDREMVGEIGADPWQFVHHLDADRFQMAGRPDARDLQQVGRVDGAAGDDDLTRRQYPAIAAILPKGNPGALPALEQQPRSNRLGLDAHIWASPRLGQKGARRRPAEAPPPRHLRIPDPLLDRAVVVCGQRKAGLLGGFDKSVRQRQDRPVIFDEERTARAAILRTPRHLMLGFP